MVEREYLIDFVSLVQVRQWIKGGSHWNANDEVYISWGRRLLYCPGLLYRNSQLLILRLLADYPDDSPGKLRDVVDGMGGVEELFKRFFRHYDVSLFSIIWGGTSPACLVV